MEPPGIALGLTSVIVAVTNEVPRVLVVRRMRHDLATPAQRGSSSAQLDSPDALPFGPFDPVTHRTPEEGLCRWVEEQTGLNLRYVEQLYTFGNRFRDPRELHGGPRVVSIAYLALAEEADVAGTGAAQWCDWYGYLPWEDWRNGTPDLVDKVVRPALISWIREASSAAVKREREERTDVCFGLDKMAVYDRVRTLERYELLYEAGLVPEAHRDHSERVGARGVQTTDFADGSGKAARLLGPPMALDNRRILATALGRIRGKLAYRPVVFELLPDAFTLLRLQRVVEALAGTGLHKQNFRRMVVAGNLVEPTGKMDQTGIGRPAELYRFRREVVRERASVGVGLPNRNAAD